MSEYIKGKGAVGVAIAYFSLRGLVSIPTEPSEYNIIFDDTKSLYKVKVVSCSYKTKYGVYSASIKTSGGNQPNTSVKKFDKSVCDIVFIVTPEIEMYSIPSHDIDSGRQLSLNVYAEYKVNFIPS